MARRASSVRLQRLEQYRSQFLALAYLLQKGHDDPKRLVCLLALIQEHLTNEQRRL
jgi:hypothetical protein